MQNKVLKIVLLFGLVVLLIGTNGIPSINGDISKTDSLKSKSYISTRSEQKNDGSGNRLALLDEGLVGYWNFNEGTGMIVHDSSGNGNNGTINGDAQWVNGVEGTGLLLNGDDIVAIPDNSVLDPSQITVCCWVELNRLAYGNGLQWNQSQMFICKGGDGTSGAYFLCQSGDNSESFFIGFQIGPWQNDNYIKAYFPLETDHWYFVTGTYDGDMMKIYLDGVILLSKDVGNISVGNDSPLYFGYNDASGYPYYLDGVLDEERVYNKALSEEEIWSLYLQPQNVPPNKPNKPSGQTSGKINTVYTYTTVTTDLNGDQVYYMWDWGDGSQSSWLGPYASNITINTTHKWTIKGSYNIKVKAKDTSGAESNWSDSLPIKMPKDSAYMFPPLFSQILEQIFERFPNALPLLRQLFWY